jgi:predicted dehydrogenase
MSYKDMNRRQFIQRVGLAAGIAGLPTILPSSVLGRGGATAPSDRVVMGFVGLGSMGFANLHGFIRQPGVQVVAVCDVNREGSNYAGTGLKGREPARAYIEEYYAAERAAGTYAGCTEYTDFRELFARPDIDALCLAVPDHWHAYMTVAAAQAGKDMYSEKPLARTIYEGQQMVRAVREHNRVFQTGSQQRSEGNFRHACELAINGYLGDIQKVYARVGGISKPCPLGAEPEPEGFDMAMWLGNAPEAPYHPERVSGGYNTEGGTWRSWREYSAGHIADWGAHNFDIAQWGLGMDGSGPVEVIPPGHGDVEDLTFLYANGIPVIRKMGPHQGMVQFIGSTGWVGVDRGRSFASDERLLNVEMKAGDKRLYESNDHRADFLSCMATRQRPIADVEIGHGSLTVCLLGEIALRLERPLKWDPAKQSFVNDAEATALLTRPMRAPWVV